MTGTAARAAPRFWDTSPHLDPRLSGGGLLGTRPAPLPGEHRNHSPRPQPVGHQLATRHALEHQPRSAVGVKKTPRNRLICLAARHPEWVLGFADATRGRRFARPALPSWTAGAPRRLMAQVRPQGDREPKALGGDGRRRTDGGDVLRRCVEGRPVSQVTTALLAWLCQRLAAEGNKGVVLMWDNASWQSSREGRGWGRAHKQRAKQPGGLRLLLCRVPVKSPWLHPLEPHGVHGQRAIVAPARLLTAGEVMSRVCDYFQAEHVEPLQQKVA